LTIQTDTHPRYLSATSGKAGGLSEVERLKAAEPCGRKFGRSGRTNEFRSLSRPARNERGESRREELFISAS
jgi:hypothetical protein